MFQRVLALVAVLGSALVGLMAHPMVAQAAISGRDVVSGSDVSALRPGTKGTVLVFVSARCPCSQGHEARLAELSREFADFTIVGVHANQDETAAETQAHFRAAALPFPVIEDSGAKLADRLGALKTPHAYVLSPGEEILFQGGVDDSHIAATSHDQYLRDALLAVRDGKKPPIAHARTLGCVIRR